MNLQARGSCGVCGQWGHYARDCPVEAGSGKGAGGLSKPMLVNRMGNTGGRLGSRFNVPSVETDTPPSSVSSDTSGPPSEEGVMPLPVQQRPQAAQAHVRSWLETSSVTTTGTAPAASLPLAVLHTNTHINTTAMKLKEELAEETCRLAEAERAALQSTREELTSARRDIALKEQGMKDELKSLERSHAEELSQMSAFFANKETVAAAQQKEFHRQTTESMRSMLTAQQEEIRKDVVKEAKALKAREKDLKALEENLMQRICAAEEAEEEQRRELEGVRKNLEERESEARRGEEELAAAKQDFAARRETLEEHEKVYTDKLNVLNEQRDKLEVISARMREAEAQHKEREETISAKDDHLNQRVERIKEKEQSITKLTSDVDVERTELSTLTDELRKLERRLEEKNLTLEAKEFSLTAILEQHTIESEEHKRNIKKQVDLLHAKKMEEERNIAEGKQAVYDLRMAAQQEADQIREALRKQEMINKTEYEEIVASKEKAREIIEQSKKIEVDLKVRVENAESKEKSATRAVKALEQDLQKLEEQRAAAEDLQEKILGERREIEKGRQEIEKLVVLSGQTQDLRDKLASETLYFNEQLQTSRTTLAQVEEATRTLLTTEADMSLREEKLVMRDIEIQEKLTTLNQEQNRLSMRHKELDHDASESLESLKRAQDQLNDERRQLAISSEEAKERDHALNNRELRFRAAEAEQIEVLKTIEAKEAACLDIERRMTSMEKLVSCREQDIHTKEEDVVLSLHRIETMKEECEEQVLKVKERESEAADREAKLDFAEQRVKELERSLDQRKKQLEFEEASMHQTLKGVEGRERWVSERRKELEAKEEEGLAELDVLMERNEELESHVVRMQAEIESLKATETVRNMESAPTSAPTTVPPCGSPLSDGQDFTRFCLPLSKPSSEVGSTRWDLTLSSDTIRQMQGDHPMPWIREMEAYMRAEIEGGYEDMMSTMMKCWGRSGGTPSPAWFMLPPRATSPVQRGSSRGSSPAAYSLGREMTQDSMSIFSTSPILRPSDPSCSESYPALMDCLWSTQRSNDESGFEEAWSKLNARVLSDTEYATNIGMEMTNELRQSKNLLKEQDAAMTKLKSENSELKLVVSAMLSSKREYESKALYTDEEIDILQDDKQTLGSQVEEQRKNTLWLEEELMKVKCTVEALEGEALTVRREKKKIVNKTHFMVLALQWSTVRTLLSAYYFRLMVHSTGQVMHRSVIVMNICKDAVLRTLLPSIQRHHLGLRFHTWELFVREKFIQKRQQRASMMLDGIKESLSTRTRLTSFSRRAVSDTFTVSQDFDAF